MPKPLYQGTTFVDGATSMFNKKLLLLLALTTSINAANALPIVDYDAFSNDDKKAVLEVDTGLIWMDFGINHKFTFSEVKDKLDTEYAEWRLPTEEEVTNLWNNLFGEIDGWSTSPKYPSHHYLDVMPEHIDYINKISAIFIQYAHVENYLEGRYQSDNGLTTALICEYSVNSRTGEFNGDDIPLYEISTLLVKKSRATLPESSMNFLFFTAFSFLVFIRHMKINLYKNNFLEINKI
jgi:hypothetical protein